jgi:hypothetical protein
MSACAGSPKIAGIATRWPWSGRERASRGVHTPKSQNGGADTTADYIVWSFRFCPYVGVHTCSIARVCVRVRMVNACLKPLLLPGGAGGQNAPCPPRGALKRCTRFYKISQK